MATSTPVRTRAPLARAATSPGVARVAATAALTPALLVLWAWAWAPARGLTHWGAAMPAAPVTATMLACIGAALLVRSTWQRRSLAVLASVLAMACLAVPGSLGALQRTVWPAADGVAPTSGVEVAVLLLACAVWVLADRERSGLATTLAVGAAAIGNLSVVGHLVGADWLAPTPRGTIGTAAPTVAMILLLAGAVWLADDSAPPGLDDGARGHRWLLAPGIAIVVPVIAVGLLSAAPGQPPDGAAATGLSAVALTMGAQVLALSVRHRDALLAVEAMLDASPDPMLFVDEADVVVHANDVAVRDLGHRRTQLLGLRVTELLPDSGDAVGRTRETVDAVWRPRGAGGPAFCVPAQRADGSSFPAEVSLSPVRLRGRTLVAVTVRDASNHEEQLAALRRLHKMQAIFMTAVSHELRTPLTVLLGVADTLWQHDDQLDALQRRRLMERMASNGRRLETLLTDLLDVDRLRRGAPPAMTAVEAGPLVLMQARRSADELGVRVVLDVDADLPTVRADPVLLPRAVDNLLSNAAKYAPGPVDVRVRARLDGITVLVEDRGDGVPEHLRAEVFEPFGRGARLDAATPGIGIGLSLVAGVADAAGGRAWVEGRSDGGPGASFRLFLPAWVPPDPTRDPDRPSTVAG